MEQIVAAVLAAAEECDVLHERDQSGQKHVQRVKLLQELEGWLSHIPKPMPTIALDKADFCARLGHKYS
jgi:hypothetical protein